MPIKEITKAFERRRKMALDSNALRLVNAKGDALPGLIIDQYNRHFVIHELTEQWKNQEETIADYLKTTLNAAYIIVKDRSNDTDAAADAVSMRVLWDQGGGAQTIVEEFGLKFEVDLKEGLNCGLFLDMRTNRHMVAKDAHQKRVLNCFAYTCSFGVHAKAAGAREVINVDISRKYLERGQRNYQLNSLACEDNTFVRANAAEYLERAVKKANMFDLIIIDPPSFARHETGHFQIKKDLPNLMSHAIHVLNPGGQLFVSTNFNGLSYGDLEDMLIKTSQGRKIKRIQRIAQDKDFPGTNTIKESYLVGLWILFGDRFHRTP